MKKVVLLAFIAFFAMSCGNQKIQRENTTEAAEKSAVVYSVDDLYANAVELVDTEVTVKGTVMHVCTHGGQRCFLMGSNEDFNIRVEAGEKIGAFNQEQMGSTLTITGILKEVKTEADAHNPSHEHGEAEGGHSDSEEAAEAHRVIAEAQAKAEVVYFMEGMTIVQEEI